LVDATFEDIEGIFIGNTLGVFSTVFINDEVDIRVKIASVLAKIIDTGILITVS
jgi:hypothetical protein